MRDLAESIDRLAKPVLDEFGLELVDIELKRQGRRLWVRLFIDRLNQDQGGITVEECGDFNQALSQLLDVEELIPESYLLEVSSPGLDRRVRKLEDFLRFVGNSLTVVLKEAYSGRKKIKGTLVGADEQGITIETGDERLEIAHGSIERANLQYRFD